MRNVWSRLAALLVFCLNAPAYSAEAPYKVAVDTEQGLVAPVAKVSFETVEQFSSMCARSTTRLQLSLPEPSQHTAIPRPPIGLVAFETELKPDTICLMAFGPHRGGIELDFGDKLPRLSDGYYALRIDGNDYGYLWLNDGQVQLLSESDIPQ